MVRVMVLGMVLGFDYATFSGLGLSMAMALWIELRLYLRIDTNWILPLCL